MDCRQFGGLENHLSLGSYSDTFDRQNVDKQTKCRTREVGNAFNVLNALFREKSGSVKISLNSQILTKLGGQT